MNRPSIKWKPVQKEQRDGGNKNHKTKIKSFNFSVACTRNAVYLHFVFHTLRTLHVHRRVQATRKQACKHNQISILFTIKQTQNLYYVYIVYMFRFINLKNDIECIGVCFPIQNQIQCILISIIPKTQFWFMGSKGKEEEVIIIIIRR